MVGAIVGSGVKVLVGAGTAVAVAVIVIVDGGEGVSVGALVGDGLAVGKAVGVFDGSCACVGVLGTSVAGRPQLQAPAKTLKPNTPMTKILKLSIMKFILVHFISNHTRGGMFFVQCDSRPTDSP